MPFRESEPGPPESLPPETAPGPSFTDVAGAALRDSNSVVSIYRGLANSGPLAPTPGYSAHDLLMSRPDLWPHRFRLAAAQSEGQANAIVADIDQQTADRTTLAAAGPMGFVVGAGMGLFDPTNLLPGRIAVRAWQEGRGALKGAIEMGTAMAVQSTAQEAALQASQEGRPFSESALNVGSSTLLGAFLGGAAGHLLPGEGAAIVGKMDAERAATEAHVSGAPAPAAEPAMGAAPTGAAATDARTLEDLTPVGAFGLEKLGDNAATRTLLKGSLAARRLATELSEVAVLVKGNLEGKTTTAGGMAPIETIARTQQIDVANKVHDALIDAWKETNFGAAANAPWFAKTRDELSKFGLPSPARVTFEDFSKQVGDAVMFEAKSDNPHIQGVADKIKPIFDEWSARAEKSVEGFKKAEQVPGENYFPHMWNKFLIRARRPEFVDKLVEKYSGDQAANAATQGRVRSHQGALEQHEGNIEKYTKRLEKKQGDLADDELLQEEVRRQNKFGYRYAEDLREGQYKNVGGIREADPNKNIEKARGGAVFETQIRKRGNTLADRASAHRAEIADLEEKLQAEHASAAAMRASIEEEIGKWHGTSTAEAKSAIKAREKYEAEREAKRAAKGGEEPKGGRLRSADEAVDRAVEAILKSDQDLSPQELRAQAHQTTERILGSPDGRLPYDQSAAGGMPQFAGQPADALRGSLAERALDVSNAWAKDAGGNDSWIERDIVKVMSNYMRTFAPDVLLAERFGDIEMKAQLRTVEEDYEKLIDAARGNEKEITRLGKERGAAIKDIAMMRDRLRGLFQIPKDDAERSIGRIAAAMRNFSTITSMGLAAAASIPDTAGVVFRWGMNSVFNDAWAPFLASLMTADRKFAKEVIRQMQVMKIVHETQSAMRHHELNGITEPYANGSPVERTLQYGADKMQLLNLMAPQTDILKAIAGTVASTGIYRAAKRAAAGKATKTDLLQLGQANIRPDLYEHIVEQYEKSGNEIDGHMLPNTEAWTHPEARAAFEAAVQRDVNLSVVTPGIDKPAFLSQPVFAVLTQFKSFTAAATTRILVANLQRSDAHTLQGLIASLGFGAMAYYVHAVATGQPLSSNPSDWAKEAVSRGNLLGWLDEANTLTSKMTRGRVDMYRAIGATKPLSRDAGRTAVENLLGPSFGKMANLTRVTGAMATGDVNAGDLNAVRRLVPYQNLWFLNRALTEVEKNVGNSVGIKQPQPRAQ